MYNAKSRMIQSLDLIILMYIDKSLMIQLLDIFYIVLDFVINSIV